MGNDAGLCGVNERAPKIICSNLNPVRQQGATPGSGAAARIKGSLQGSGNDFHGLLVQVPWPPSTGCDENHARMESLNPLAALRAALLAAYAMACGCTPALNWRELSVGERAKASFPCRPESATRALTLGGRPVQMQLKACEAGQVLWAVSSAQLADEALTAEALLELRRSLIANLAGSDKVEPGTGRVLIEGRHEDGSRVWARAVFLSSGREVYQLVILPRAGTPLPAEEVQDYFFSGLRAESVKRLP